MLPSIHFFLIRLYIDHIQRKLLKLRASRPSYPKWASLKEALHGSLKIRRLAAEVKEIKPQTIVISPTPLARGMFSLHSGILADSCASVRSLRVGIIYPFVRHCRSIITDHGLFSGSM